MTIVEEKVYHADTDSYTIITKETHTSKEREKKRAKFKCNPIRDYITEANRKKYGHICSRCKDKKSCQKWIGKIILKCEDFRR